MKKTVLYFFLLLITSCIRHDSINGDFDMQYHSDDDYFKMNDASYDRLLHDSLTGVKDTSIKIVFTESEKERVRKTLNENNFLGLPELIAGKCISPSSHTQIFIKYEGKKKMVKYIDACDYDDKISAKKMETIISTIDSILKTKKEIYNLPKSGFITL